MNAANETPERHVDGGSVEDGREDNESGLDYVGRELLGVEVTEYAGDVADYLNWEEESVSENEYTFLGYSNRFEIQGSGRA